MARGAMAEFGALVLVCHCTVVNDRRLRELISDGAADLLDVAAACGAGSFCGGCVPTIASLLSQATGEPASAILDRAPSTLDDKDEASLPTRLRQVVRAVEEQLLEDGSRVGAPVASDEVLGRRHGATRGVVRDAIRVLREHGTGRSAGATGGLVVGVPDIDAISAVSALHLRAVGATPKRPSTPGASWKAWLSTAPASTRTPPLGTSSSKQRGDSALLLDEPGFHHALAAVSANPALSLLVAVLIRLDTPTAPTSRTEARSPGPEHTALARGGHGSG